MSDPTPLDPGEEDPLYEKQEEDTPAEQDEDTARARHLVFAIAAPGRDLPRVLRSHFRCLGCGDVLPAWRGSWCDACIEWSD